MGANQNTCQEKTTLDKVNLIEVESQPEETPSNSEEQGKLLLDKADSYESKEQEKPIKQLCDSQSGVSYAKDHQPVQGFHDHRKTEPIHETSELLADLPICKSSKHEAKMKLEILETISLVENVSEVKASETVFKTPESQVLTNSQRKRRNKKNKMNKFKDSIGRIDQTNFSQEQRDKFNKVNLGVCQTQKSNKKDKKLPGGVQKSTVKNSSTEDGSFQKDDKPQTSISATYSDETVQQSTCQEATSLDEVQIKPEENPPTIQENTEHSVVYRHLSTEGKIRRLGKLAQEAKPSEDSDLVCGVQNKTLARKPSRELVRRQMKETVMQLREPPKAVLTDRLFLGKKTEEKEEVVKHTILRIRRPPPKN